MRPDHNDGLLVEHGVEVREKLLTEIKRHPKVDIIYLSMRGIHVVDASFSREAIIRTIKTFRGELGFCLTDIDNSEYLDNFVAGVMKLDQPIFIKLPDRIELISPFYPKGPSKGNQEVLDYVNAHNMVTATMLKSDLHLKLTNASSKLKQLLEQGYLLRKQDTAISGGVEFKYFAIQ